jgi:hypothetical protein
MKTTTKSQNEEDECTCYEGIMLTASKEVLRVHPELVKLLGLHKMSAENKMLEMMNHVESCGNLFIACAQIAAGIMHGEITITSQRFKKPEKKEKKVKSPLPLPTKKEEKEIKLRIQNILSEK